MSNTSDNTPVGLKPIDLLLQKISEILNFINKAKQELAALSPDEIKDVHLQSAHDELDAIVQATADATNTIMDAVEKIENMQGLTEDQKDEICGITTLIYEACTFQDITGQRIRKVVKTLKSIEEQIIGLLQAFGGISGINQNIPGEEKTASASTQEQSLKNDSKEKEFSAEELLNGPQLPNNAVSQNEIDDLFNSLLKK